MQNRKNEDGMPWHVWACPDMPGHTGHARGKIGVLSNRVIDVTKSMSQAERKLNFKIFTTKTMSGVISDNLLLRLSI